ncbi:MAG: hypothetical protein QXL57_07420 [Candidatus Bathyarchaeia archaeon]
MCIQALEQLGGRKKYVPLKDIVAKVHELWLTQNVNEETIRCQVFRHCINCHPTHDEFPDKGKMWRQRKLFVTDGKGNYRFYDEGKDRKIYVASLREDEEERIEVPSKFLGNRKKESKRAAPLTDVYINAIQKLQVIGNKLGFKTEDGVRIEGGEVDHVWFIDFGANLPYFGSKIPVVGFEIETSWRTRKHIKGDVFNLLTINSAFGIILFLRQGFRSESQFKGNVNAAKRYVRTFEGRKKIFVWSEEDLSELWGRINLLRK